MQISSQFSIGNVDALRSVSQSSNAAAPQSITSSGLVEPTDQLDISAEAQSILSSQASTTSSDIRVDKVAELRRQIATGSYDSDEKVSAALDKFLATIG